ncbi:ABC-type molybdenum transport system ATPase subunit/photorepair protein PhrA [Polaromonas sp. CG_9.7]|nr:ABC-type molybdenum transport system ATPase subunit/photorepair protein PhrA [Polaromonas sp. CG_9.7]
MPKNKAGQVKHLGQFWIGTTSISGSVFGRRQQPLQPLATKFIDAIDLVHFRNWPQKQTFDSLGTVNLLVGSNGVGKTSMLEAIEFFYCQDNARTTAPGSAHVRIRLQDSAKWLDTKVSANSAEAKQRNLDWYGQRDLKGSTLKNSFARFNFLATDDAATLGQKDAKISFEEMLSRLVAGPQTAELWDHISRIQQPVAAELARIQTGLHEATKRKGNIATLIKTAEASPRASDSDFSALAEDLLRLHWIEEPARNTIASVSVPALTRASSIIRELLTAKLGLQVVSPATVSIALQTVSSALTTAEERVNELAEVDLKIRTGRALEAKLKREIEAFKSIQQAQQLGAFSLTRDLDRLNRQHSALKAIVGSEAIPIERPIWFDTAAGTLGEQSSSVIEQSKELKNEILRLNEELVSARAAQEATTSLVAELRTLAIHYLQSNPSHKDCPVCATSFDPGQLLQRLKTVALEASAEKTAPILNGLEAAKQAYSLAESKRLTLTYLLAYAKRTEFSTESMTMHEVHSNYLMQRERFEETHRLLSEVAQRISDLTSAGVALGGIAELLQLAQDLGIDAFASNSADQELLNKGEELRTVINLLHEYAADEARLMSSIRFTLLSDGETNLGLDHILEESRDRRKLLQKAKELIEELGAFVMLEESSDATSIAVKIESAKIAAERFAAALVTENSSRAAETSARAQLTQIEVEISEYEDTAKRLKLASAELTELKSDDSLTDATNTELLGVQATTDTVFRRIHSPHEYGVQRNSHAPLFRLDAPNKSVTLRDISTGQRAAFVLSVFMAMNSKLQTAPPVLLFDDPIAHVDDFNSLSFLDHLRDVALMGNRQIFYATADARLAGLFEHKFSFLGNKFRRFDLVR